MSWEQGNGTLEVVILLYGWSIYAILQYCLRKEPRRGKREKEEGMGYACI